MSTDGGTVTATPGTGARGPFVRLMVRSEFFTLETQMVPDNARSLADALGNAATLAEFDAEQAALARTAAAESGLA